MIRIEFWGKFMMYKHNISVSKNAKQNDLSEINIRKTDM